METSLRCQLCTMTTDEVSTTLCTVNKCGSDVLLTSHSPTSDFSLYHQVTDHKVTEPGRHLLGTMM